MTDLLRPGMMLVVVLLTACNTAGVDVAVGRTDGTSAVILGQTDTGITVENQVGRPLLNIRITIEPGGPGGMYIYTLPTLDPGVRREVPFTNFRAEDGTLFEPGTHVPKQIKATARDTLGNTHEVSTPWER